MTASGLLTWVTDYLTKKTEYSQSISRVFVSSVYLVYLLLTQFEQGSQVIYVVATYGIISYLWLAWVIQIPELTIRRNLSLFGDQLAITTVLWVVGPFHPGILFMYCWLAIDYGYRYGSPYVLRAGTVSLLGFMVLLYAAPQWAILIDLPVETLVIFLTLTWYKRKILLNLEFESQQRNIYQEKAKQAEERVLRDDLTGLCNRSYAEDWLKKKHRKNSRVSILFLDLDEFKKFNDNFGHDVGDQVLINISKRLNNCVRDGDVVCRYAGDEFIILLDDENPDTIKQIGKRITRALNQAVQIETGQRLTVTGSIGIAVMGIHGDTPAEAIRNADAAMYMAKRQGRNRMAWFEEKVRG